MALLSAGHNVGVTQGIREEFGPLGPAEEIKEEICPIGAAEEVREVISTAEEVREGLCPLGAAEDICPTYILLQPAVIQQTLSAEELSWPLPNALSTEHSSLPLHGSLSVNNTTFSPEHTLSVEEIVTLQSDDSIKTVSDNEGEEFRCSRKKIYCCDFCKFFLTNSLEEHNSHYAAHSGTGCDKAYKCKICDKKFHWSNCLKSHEYTHLTDRYSDHQKEEESSDPQKLLYKCDECNTTMTTWFELQNHYQDEGSEFPGKNLVYGCCDRKFPSSSALNFHRSTHKPSVPFLPASWCTLPAPVRRVPKEKLTEKQLDILDKIFHKQQNVKWKQTVNIAIQTGLSIATVRNWFKYMRAKQKKYLMTKGELARPKSKKQSKDIIMEHGATSVTDNNTDSEVDVSHPSGKKLLICEICDKKVTTPGGLKLHYRTHKGKHPYKCDICLKPFADISTLRKHERIHSSFKSYLSKTRGKSLLTAASLKDQIRTQTEDSSYSCSACGMLFRRQLKLKQHYRIHSQEKHYNCNICNKSFSSKEKLKLHSYSHFPTCGDCGKKFSNPYNLKRHRQIHTGEKPFSCTFCDKTFSQQSHLKTHLRTHTS